MYDVVVRIGRHHNKWIVVLKDFEGPLELNDYFFDALQRRLRERQGGNGIDVDTLDYIEIMGHG